MPFVCFIILVLSMFVNLILAFLHARGLPMSSGIVMGVQALITASAIPAFLSPRVKLRHGALMALSFIIFSTVVMNFLNPFNIKTMYDTILIPIYIALGMSASYIRPKWMNYLLLFVFLIVVLEIIAPQAYVGLFNPAEYLSSTRDWVANQKANAATAEGLYTGAIRGESFFSFADHRIGGTFLEPLSLGYFAFLMSTYYAGLYQGPRIIRTAAIVICVCIALASDSRVPTALILVSTLFLTMRWRLPTIVLWLTFPVVILAVYAVYLQQFGFLYGDTFGRISITFDGLARVNLGQIMAGMVPLERAGDSGILYMLRCVGLLGMPVAVWFYSGAYTLRPGTNVSFFVMIVVYLTITLMFGGASLSIKTASLLGYLVGLASLRADDVGPPRPLETRTRFDEEAADSVGPMAAAGVR
jgi:hypothetical protein